MSRGQDEVAHVREIHRRLRRAHGPLGAPRRLDPLEELVLTILSQNTNDTNRDRAYESMRRRYRTWNALSRARVGDLVETIRVGGLANRKAPRIIETLREIRAREGGFDLSWMHGASDADVRDYLTSLPGVGPKTAACVLAFSLGRAVIPVDTHVHRVATRLGLLPADTSAARAHQVLDALIPPRLRLSMHVGLIRHGRTVCRAGRPFCEDCVLHHICPTAPYFLGKRPALGRSGDSRKWRPDVDN
ncbi:MAG TPA: endonuclease III [Actinomycetota bacterium]|nr:endonuclease III [Actinomycetota bacterium]